MGLTLARPIEVVEARWSEFDLDAALWRIPAERMKMNSAHIVPLPTQAVALLRRLHAITDQREVLFPHRDERLNQ
jgi:integrase